MPPARTRRQPKSFLGGPFLIRQLHQLPLPLVDLIFTFPSANPTRNHSDFVQDGQELLVIAAARMAAENHPDWHSEQRRALVDRCLRHSVIRELAVCWALDERARDVAPFDEDNDKLEALVLALAGGIHTHLGHDAAFEWLRVVLAGTFEKGAKRAEEKAEREKRREATRVLTPAPLTPPTPLVALTDLASPPLAPLPLPPPTTARRVSKPPPSAPSQSSRPSPSPPPSPPPPTKAEAPLPPPPHSTDPPPPLSVTTYSRVQDAIRSLPEEALKTAFTHATVNPFNSLDLFARDGYAFLRSVVHAILLRNAPPGQPQDRIEHIIDLTVSPDTIGPLARSWNLDWPARGRAPEAFLHERTDLLFCSLIGAMFKTHGNDFAGEWLMDVMGECTRQKYEAVEASERAARPKDPFPGALGILFAQLNRLPPESFDIVFRHLKTIGSAGHEIAQKLMHKIILERFKHESKARRSTIFHASICLDAFRVVAETSGLLEHPSVVGRDMQDRHDLVLLAILKQIYDRGSESEALAFLENLFSQHLVSTAERVFDHDEPTTDNMSTPPPQAKNSIDTFEIRTQPLFEPPDRGPQLLKVLLSFMQPSTLDQIFVHPSLDDVHNYTRFLPTGDPPVSVLSTTLRTLWSEWYPRLSDKTRAIILEKALGRWQLARLARALGIAQQLRTSPEVRVHPSHLRDATIALVQAASATLPPEDIKLWVEDAFRTLCDQIIEAWKPPPADPSATHAPPTHTHREKLAQLAARLNLPLSFEVLGRNTDSGWTVRVSFGAGHAATGVGADEREAGEEAAHVLWISGRLRWEKEKGKMVPKKKGAKNKRQGGSGEQGSGQREEGRKGGGGGSSGAGEGARG